jgi:hypothetical protein
MPIKQAATLNAKPITTSFEKKAQNDNLTSTQRTIRRIHYRRGHESMAKIQHMTRDGHYDLPIEISKCKIPQCRARDFRASKQRPHESHTGGLAKNNKIDQPGTFVSTDQMISGSPGLIPFTSGKPSARRYQLATLWCDHYSKILYSHLQESTNAKQTLISKTNFETFAQHFNVNIKQIHSDNGVYKSETFMDHCIAANQTQSFSGVGAHWQNGVIERYIGVISTMRAR